jgi:hypothetical protein
MKCKATTDRDVIAHCVSEALGFLRSMKNQRVMRSPYSVGLSRMPLRKILCAARLSWRFGLTGTATPSTLMTCRF